MALQVHFSSFDILKTFTFFVRREMTCFAVVWTTWAYDDNFVLLSQKRWFQFNSRIVRTHFACAMTFNNCDIIEETRSYIFRWRSRCRRRRLCLSSLISLFIKVSRHRLVDYVKNCTKEHGARAARNVGLKCIYMFKVKTTTVNKYAVCY